MKYDFIEAHRHLYGVKLLCQGLQVSRSGYYAAKHRLPSRTLAAADDAHHSDQRDPQCQP
jgi:hypothetical protein